MISCQQAAAAVAQFGTIFFDRDLKPVTPAPGMWFCEFDSECSDDPEQLRDEAIVEYLGPCEAVVFDQASAQWVKYGAPAFRFLVAPEGGEARRPWGAILIKQGA